MQDSGTVAPLPWITVMDTHIASQSAAISVVPCRQLIAVSIWRWLITLMCGGVCVSGGINVNVCLLRQLRW